MRLSVQAKNVMLDALDESASAGAKFASLHNAYGADGTAAAASELTGGSPPYARKAVTWAPAAAGAKAIVPPVVFDVAGSSIVRFIGFWDAVTAGNYLGMTPNGGTAPQAFVVPDPPNDTLECADHGFQNGDTVVLWAEPADPLPAGLAEGTIYYVINKTLDDLQLSATLGGSAINVTGVGAGTLQKIVTETFGGQGTHTLTAITLTLD